MDVYTYPARVAEPFEIPHSDSCSAKQASYDRVLTRRSRMLDSTPGADRRTDYAAVYAVERLAAETNSGQLIRCLSNEGANPIPLHSVRS